MAVSVPTDRGPLADVLRRLRDEREVTQPELVRQTAGQLTAGHIGQVETGDRGMSPEKVEVVAKALKLSKAERTELEEAARLYRQRNRLGKAAARSGVKMPDDLRPEEAAEIQAKIDEVVRKRGRR